MPRFARVVVPGVAHHVIQRGNRRQRVFFGDGDKVFYLSLLRRHARPAGIDFSFFCLMENHIHLIAVPRSKHSLARGLGEAHRRYTLWINLRQGWSGYLWQGRFQSHPLDSHYLVAAARYIELNPVRARIVRCPEDYPWSSARVHVRHVPHDLLIPNPLADAFPDWRAFLAERSAEAEIKTLREHMRTGRPLGNEAFIKKLEKTTGRVLRLKKRGRKPIPRG